MRGRDRKPVATADAFCHYVKVCSDVVLHGVRVLTLRRSRLQGFQRNKISSLLSKSLLGAV